MNAQLTNNGHIPTTNIPYNASPYSFNPNMLQVASSSSADSDIKGGDIADLFVNFNFDTSDKNIFIVCTDDGSTPNKNSGSSTACSFSTYTDPDRLWRCQIPNTKNIENKEIKYVFYISDSDLASAWGTVNNSGGYQTTWEENNLTPFSYTVEQTPLPVTLLNFNIYKKEHSVLLKWATASEVNNKFFEIERSKNIDDFEKVGTIDGNGSSLNLKSYEFIDNKPLNGVSYYRLKQIDLDNSFTYSKIISTIFYESDFLKIGENPNNGILNVFTKENINYNLIDLNGKNIKSGRLHKGENNLDFSNLPNGLYPINFNHNENKISTKKVLINN